MAKKSRKRRLNPAAVLTPAQLVEQFKKPHMIFRVIADSMKVVAIDAARGGQKDKAVAFVVAGALNSALSRTLEASHNKRVAEKN